MKSNLTGRLFRIQRYSVHDGPGIRTTVFFKGCPLSCWWCHNPEGIESDITENQGYVISVADIIKEIEKDELFYDESGGGVTFSGGEPLNQPDFLIAVLKECKVRGIHTTLDTSGFGNSNCFKKALSYIDLVLFDLKLIDNEEHQTYTGVPISLIHTNLSILEESRVNSIIRFPIIPSITDTEANLNAVIRKLSHLKFFNRIDLLPFHKTMDGKYGKMNRSNQTAHLHTLTEKVIERIKEYFVRAGFSVSIGG